jgi:hypothetical protein
MTPEYYEGNEAHERFRSSQLIRFVLPSLLNLRRACIKKTGKG